MYYLIATFKAILEEIKHLKQQTSMPGKLNRDESYNSLILNNFS